MDADSKGLEDEEEGEEEDPSHPIRVLVPVTSGMDFEGTRGVRQRPSEPMWLCLAWPGRGNGGSCNVRKPSTYSLLIPPRALQFAFHFVRKVTTTYLVYALDALGALLALLALASPVQGQCGAVRSPQLSRASRPLRVFSGPSISLSAGPWILPNHSETSCVFLPACAAAAVLHWTSLYWDSTVPYCTVQYNL